MSKVIYLKITIAAWTFGEQVFQEIITRCWPHFFKQLQNNNMITHKLIFCIFCKFPVQELKICSFITYLSLVLYQSKLILADEEGRNVVDQCENVSYVWFTQHLCKNLICFRFSHSKCIYTWNQSKSPLHYW